MSEPISATSNICSILKYIEKNAPSDDEYPQIQNISLPKAHGTIESRSVSPLQLDMCSRMAREQADWNLHFAHFEMLRI